MAPEILETRSNERAWRTSARPSPFRHEEGVINTHAEARPQVTGWLWTAGLNSVLGYLGVVPLGLFIGVLTETVGVWLGWVPAGTHWGQEGIGVQLGLPLMLALGFAAMFWALNHLISRLLKVRGRRFWLIAALITLTPTVVFLIEPQWWRAISWL